MRCMFCNEEVLKTDSTRGLPITLPGRGVAHTYCAEKDLAGKRIFGNIHIKDLSDEDLAELREMVMVESHERQYKNI